MCTVCTVQNVWWKEVWVRSETGEVIGSTYWVRTAVSQLITTILYIVVECQIKVGSHCMSDQLQGERRKLTARYEALTVWRHPGVWLSSGENVRTYRISIVRIMSQAITHRRREPLFGGFNWLSSEIFWISKKCSKHSVEIKIANRMGFVDFYQCNQWLNNSSMRNPNFRSKLSGRWTMSYVLLRNFSCHDGLPFC